MQSNLAAHQFWEYAISAFTGEAIHPVFAEKGERHWKLYSFQVGQLAQDMPSGAKENV
jgi:hypothetical protein